jgi:hypothetical protein
MSVSHSDVSWQKDGYGRVDARTRADGMRTGSEIGSHWPASFADGNPDQPIGHGP